MTLDHPNFQALDAFAKQIRNNLSKGNKLIQTANCKVKYTVGESENEVVTSIFIALNNIPNPELTIIEQDWLLGPPKGLYYTQFNAAYNDWTYDTYLETLRIECSVSTRLGHSYKVEIREV